MSTTQEPDPFGRAPQSDPYPAASPQGANGPSGPRAGFGKRFAAILLDGIIVTAVSVPFLFIEPALYYVVSILGGIIYYSVLEGGAKGQTVGKMALGIRVIDLGRGGPIGVGRGFIRYIGRIVSSIFMLGYLWMLWDKEKQTWHDKMAGSVVVPVSSYPVN